MVNGKMTQKKWVGWLQKLLMSDRIRVFYFCLVCLFGVKLLTLVLPLLNGFSPTVIKFVDAEMMFEQLTQI